MERQFLTILLFNFIFLSGCQTSIEAISYNNTEQISKTSSGIVDQNEFEMN